MVGAEAYAFPWDFESDTRAILMTTVLEVGGEDSASISQTLPRHFAGGLVRHIVSVAVADQQIKRFAYTTDFDSLLPRGPMSASRGLGPILPSPRNVSIFCIALALHHSTRINKYVEVGTGDSLQIGLQPVMLRVDGDSFHWRVFESREGHT